MKHCEDYRKISVEINKCLLTRENKERDMTLVIRSSPRIAIDQKTFESVFAHK